MFSSSLHLLNLFLQEQKTQFRLDDACLFLGQQAPEHIEMDLSASKNCKFWWERSLPVDCCSLNFLLVSTWTLAPPFSCCGIPSSTSISRATCVLCVSPLLQPFPFVGITPLPSWSWECKRPPGRIWGSSAQQERIETPEENYKTGRTCEGHFDLASSDVAANGTVVFSVH